MMGISDTSSMAPPAAPKTSTPDTSKRPHTPTTEDLSSNHGSDDGTKSKKKHRKQRKRRRRMTSSSGSATGSEQEQHSDTPELQRTTAIPSGVERKLDYIIIELEKQARQLKEISGRTNCAKVSI